MAPVLGYWKIRGVICCTDQMFNLMKLNLYITTNIYIHIDIHIEY